MTQLHQVLAWVVVVSAGFSGAWIAAAHSRERLRHSSMWIAAHIAHAAIAAQATVGALLFSSTEGDVSQFHMFYGFLTLVGVGIIIAYKGLSEYRYLLYGLGNLFVMGLAIRAMTL